MTMPRSPAAGLLFLFLSILVLSADASRSNAATAPAPAGPRQEAVLAYQNLVKEGQALLVESERGVAECKDEEFKGCLTTLDGNLKRFVASISPHEPDQSDAKFGEARDVLTAILSIPSSSGVACSEKAASTYPVVDKIYKFEDNLQATLNLMSSAMPAPPPPAEPEEDDEEDAKLEAP